MYWFILLFPLMIYPWGYDAYYTLPKTAYLDIFVLGMWLYIVLKRKYWTLNLRKPHLNGEFLIILFMLLVVVSTVFSVNINTSINGTEKRYEGLLTFFSYCSVFLFSYRLLDSTKLRKVIPGMAFISVIVSVYGILQHYLLDFLPRNSSKLMDVRSSGFFDNPNFFGSYLVLVMLLTITLYLTEKDSKLSIFYYLTSGLAFVALLFTGTRSGWVGVFIGLVLVTLFVVFQRKYLWKRWALLLVTLGIIIAVVNASENGNYVNRANTVVKDTVQLASKQSTGHEGSNRFFIWKKALPLVKTYFWTGSGPDTLEFVFPASPEELTAYFANPKAIVDKAHNEYLHMAVTLGVPALLVYLSLILVVLGRAYQAARTVRGNEKIYLLGLIATILGYLAQAFFNISVVPVAPLFWAILGITLAKSELALKYRKGQTLEKKIVQSA